MSPRLVPLAFALISLTGLAVAQTNVGGPIFSNTTWTTAGSPYQLTSSIIIGAGATLTIDPGVEVRFTSTGRILIVGETSLGAGTLVARGTAGQPVRFTSTAGTPGSWDAILFTDRAVDAQFNMSGAYMSGSILEHCIVEFAGGSTSYEGAVEILNSSPFLSDCVVRNNARRGVRGSMAAGSTGPTPPLNMVGCELRQNGRGGLSVSSGSSHRISNCSFVQNSGTSGVSGVGASLGSTPDSRIENCSFVGNNGSSGAGLHLSSSANCVVVDSTFSSNISSSSGGAAYASSCSSLRFETCRFEDNQASAGAGVFSSSCSGLLLDACDVLRNSASTGAGFFLTQGTTTLQQCVVEDNVSTGSGGGIYVASTSSFLATGTRIERNRATTVGGGIHSNSATGSIASCVIAENESMTDGGGIYTNSALTITDTQIHCNTADDGGGMYLDGSGAAVTISGNSTTGVFNSLQGNTANRGDQIFDDRAFDQTNGLTNVPASYICWGLIDPNAVPNAIWDFFDNSSLSIVLASNYASCSPVGCGCVGVNYCTSNTNSSGSNATIGYTGSTSLAANNFDLTVSGCPANKSGIFFYGALQANLPFGAGVRCVDSPLQRLSLVTTDALGGASYAVDLTAPPAAGVITANSVWNFQFWFRDPGFAGSNFNTSDGLEVKFCD